MKTHEITTSKGEFVVMDLPNDNYASLIDVNSISNNEKTFVLPNGSLETISCFIPVGFKPKLICKLSEATEEQAKGVVDESIHTGLFAHYVEDIPVNTFCYKSALYSLHSLLKSKGIDINNGNWYLFKKI